MVSVSYGISQNLFSGKQQVLPFGWDALMISGTFFADSLTLKHAYTPLSSDSAISIQRTKVQKAGGLSSALVMQMSHGSHHAAALAGAPYIPGSYHSLLSYVPHCYLKSFIFVICMSIYQ
jgi:hypothetical protein